MIYYAYLYLENIMSHFISVVALVFLCSLLTSVSYAESAVNPSTAAILAKARPGDTVVIGDSDHPSRTIRSTVITNTPAEKTLVLQGLGLISYDDPTWKEGFWIELRH